jgi:hypothetical protein
MDEEEALFGPLPSPAEIEMNEMNAPPTQVYSFLGVNCQPSPVAATQLCPVGKDSKTVKLPLGETKTSITLPPSPKPIAI